MNILILNAGSSSQKSSLYRFTADQPPSIPTQPRWKGTIDFGHFGRTEGCAEVKAVSDSNQTIVESIHTDDRTAAVQRLFETLFQGPTQVVASKSDIQAVGHRVVHGGPSYCQPVLIDDAVKSTIRKLIPLAPAHNAANLAGIEMAQALFGPDIPQYAVFDTAFHSQMPDCAALYPVPQEWISQGIRRYGFHGISHQYCAHRAAELLNRPLNNLRLVTSHLGNGCSLCAVQGGLSIDTTMGFTPLDGLMMGTRSGSVDPGILTYLMREHRYTPEQIDHQLNKASGLKGVSGLSGDMREIVSAMESGHHLAKLAFDIYIHRLCAGIAAMAASLGGLDALVFTAGVGEHSSLVRARVAEKLAFLGVTVSAEEDTTADGDRIISTENSAVSTLVIHTQEDWQIAKAYWQIKQAL